MPPRPHRETPESRDRRIRKHVAQAREYWGKGAIHLRERDISQAAEKGWGTVAQLTKAVATLRGWDHYGHEAIRDCVYALADENASQQRQIRRALLVAEGLHGHFYEVYMDLPTAELAMEDIVPLLEILWGLLPGDYTGGGAFNGQAPAKGE